MTFELKQLIILRHAERGGGLGSGNSVGISSRGLEQATAFAEQICSQFQGGNATEIALFSSPANRCQATLNPLSARINSAVSVHPDLNEQGHTEETDGMTERIERVVENWKANSQKKLTIFCTHNDWIASFYVKYFGREIWFDTCQSESITLVGGELRR